MVSSEKVPIDLLLSYAFHPKLNHKDIHDRLPPGSLVWIDSGAFTAYTTGREVTKEAYAEHLVKNAGGFDYAFTLDVIGDHLQSMKQTEWLWEQGHEVLPIFTFGTPLAEFRVMCRDYGYVGAGGLVPVAKDRHKLLRYLRTLTRIAEEYGTAVHALGIAGRDTVIRSRVWSADSSTVSSAPLYGNVPIYDRQARKLRMLQASDPEGLYKYRKDLLHYGFPLAQVMRERKWTSAERPAMFRASLLSVADMWDEVRGQYPVPAPERLPVPATWRNRPDGGRPAYALGPGNDTGLAETLRGPHAAHAAHAADVTSRLDAALDGPRSSTSYSASAPLDEVLPNPGVRVANAWSQTHGLDDPVTGSRDAAALNTEGLRGVRGVAALGRESDAHFTVRKDLE